MKTSVCRQKSYCKTVSCDWKNKNVLRCQLESEHGKLVTAIRFKLDGQEIPEIGRKISMVYYPDINEYNGIVSIQFRIEDWRYV